MNLLDLLLVVIVGSSMITGFMAGFARVGIGFLASLFGMLFAFWFYGIPAGWLHGYFISMTVCNLLGFFVVFFAFVIAGALVARILSNLFKWTGLSWLNRLLGAAFGFVRGSLIAIVFVAVLLAFTSKPLPHWMVDSQVLPYAIDGSHWISELAPATIKDAFIDSMNQIRKAWDEEMKKHQKRREQEPRAAR
jgi:membrane protein required for colicin V production